MTEKKKMKKQQESDPMLECIFAWIKPKVERELQEERKRKGIQEVELHG